MEVAILLGAICSTRRLEMALGLYGLTRPFCKTPIQLVPPNCFVRPRT